MLQYKTLFFKNIGSRIRKIREEKNFTQIELAKLTNITNYSLLSLIENGNAGTPNPHLIPKYKIKEISEVLSISQKELIWGTKKEREDFIKTALLAILMNGDKFKTEEMNPFINSKPSKKERTKISQEQKQKDKKEQKEQKEQFLENYYIWALKQDFPKKDNYYNFLPDLNTLTEPERKYIYKVQEQLYDDTYDYFTKKYGMFYNPCNYENYEILKNGYDEKHEELSNLLLKLILHDAIFMQSFIDRLCNVYFNQATISEHKYDIRDYLEGKGTYGLIALDFKEYDYYKFIKAFNRFWTKSKSSLMFYFNKELFKDEEYEWLKKYNDNYFHDIFCSPKLINTIRYLENWDSYYDMNAIMAKNYQLTQLQKHQSLIYSLASEGKDELEEKFYTYISTLHEDTIEFIKDNFK